MRRVEPILLVVVLAAAVALTGCAKPGKNTSAPAPPAPPPPTSSVKPVHEPLSIPQTQVQLPPPQPWNPASLAVAAPAAPAPAVTRTVRRASPPAAPPPKPEPAAPTTPAASQPAERPPIQAIVPADERRRYQEEADARKRETHQLLEQVKGRRLTGEQNKMVQRINSFVTQSDDAEKRGDMRQADALAERALVLAKGLPGAQ